MRKTGLFILGFAGLVLLLVALAILIHGRRPPKTERVPTEGPTKAAADVSAPESSPDSGGKEPKDIVIEIPVEEVRYLPDRVAVPEQDVSVAATGAEFTSGNRRITNIRQLTSVQQDGMFISPRFSPDGLQMLITRPGFDGIYVVPTGGGEPVAIADGNAFNATWTPGGKIQAIDSEGNRRLYAPDGTLESTEPYDRTREPVYADNDTVYVRSAPDHPALPLTSTDDRYMAPVLSPDGNYVTYCGLYTGVYLAPVDGSAPPRFLGEGNHPVWLPDSSGVVFDYTRDDGHNLIAGDIYYADVNGRERTNLTPGVERILQSPSVGPGGGSIAFESNGEIFVGEMQ